MARKRYSWWIILFCPDYKKLQNIVHNLENEAQNYLSCNLSKSMINVSLN